MASEMVRTNEKATLDKLRELMSERLGGAHITVVACVDYAIRYALTELAIKTEVQRERDEKALAAENHAATVRSVVGELHERGLLKTDMEGATGATS